MSFQPYRNTVKRRIMKIYILQFESPSGAGWVNVEAYKTKEAAQQSMNEAEQYDKSMGLGNWVYRIQTIDLYLENT